MKFRTLGAVWTCLSIVIAGIVSLGLFSGLELSLTDRLFGPRPVDSRIIIVGIDAKSLAELGQWPLPRAVIADGIRNIAAGDPASIGVDIIFADPSRLGEADDSALEKVLRESPVPIVLPAEALTLRIRGETVPRAESLLSTLPRFSGDRVTFGHVNLIKDRDGIVRRFPDGILSPEGTLVPSFSTQVIGTDGAGTIEHVVWSGAPGTVQHLSFSDVALGAVPPETFAGAYVFVGATAADLHDEQTTPVSAGTAMAGVEIQAQIGNMLLSGHRLRDLSFPASLLWIAALIILPSLLFFYIRNVFVTLPGALFLLCANTVLVVVLFEQGIRAHLVYTTLTLVLSSLASFSVRYFILERERREIKGVFSKYVSKAVLDELLKDPEKVALGGVEAEVTVFFSDIRGFTTLSEKLSPSELTKLLNRYLTRMTDIILRDGGVVDKYIGDAIMAFWGAPLPDPRHAERAIQSSLAMLESLDEFNRETTSSGQPAINIGIGLNTGTVIVGNMGSAQRFDYTIMGDAVNLGSRLEGQTKTYGVRILVSEMTIASLIKERVPNGILYREIDRVTVKGKTKPVAVFEIVERKRETFVRTILEDFEKLREAYYQGDWDTAVTLGESVLARGEDGPTQVLLGRSREYRTHLPEQWEGVYQFTSK